MRKEHPKKSDDGAGDAVALAPPPRRSASRHPMVSLGSAKRRGASRGLMGPRGALRAASRSPHKASRSLVLRFRETRGASRGPCGPKCGQIGQDSAKLGAEFSPASAWFKQIWPKVGNTLAQVDQFCEMRANVGQHETPSGPNGQNMAKVWPNLRSRGRRWDNRLAILGNHLGSPGSPGVILGKEHGANNCSTTFG